MSQCVSAIHLKAQGSSVIGALALCGSMDTGEREGKKRRKKRLPGVLGPPQQE